MKSLALFLCLAALGSAADFQTGQAARMVIGQPIFTAQTPVSSDVVLGGVGGVAFANNTLFVTDSNRLGSGPDNNRVLVYRNILGAIPPPTAEFDPYTGRCLVCTGAATIVLGQPDFAGKDPALSRTGMRLPTAVASDGNYVAVSDTNNNRILIWTRIPDSNATPADVVVGQEAFDKRKAVTTDNRSLRGPQGVWIQNGKLFVADTQNHRVLIWNSIPTSNNQAADIVLGQSNFDTGPQVDLTQAPVTPKANNLLNPVSVTSDGRRLFVTDLGHNRVLIWNTIPTQNQTPADVVVGQPDMESADANNSAKLCPSNGTAADGTATYPRRCATTMDFPRYALSDGTRLFVADGGNDRVLVYSQVPTSNGQPANIVLGQGNAEANQSSDNALPERVSSADSFRTPTSLAWDGTNLYVTDTFNRRVMVFTPGDLPLPITGVRNAASIDVFAVGSITFSGTIKADNEITIKIVDTEYKYKIATNDNFDSVINNLVALINAGAGDPNVLATPNTVFGTLLLTSRKPGEEGNAIAYSTSTSDAAQIVLTTAGANLAGGQNAARIAPGTLVSLLGDNFTDKTVSIPENAEVAAFELGGIQVYFDGMRAPLFMVSPNQINAQVPFEFSDTTSVTAWVRIQQPDGSVRISNAIAVPIIAQNPGLFAESGSDPRPGIVLHGSSYASGSVSVDGTPKENDVVSILIENRKYSHTVPSGATLESIRDALIEAINAANDKVVASAGGQFTRVRLRSRVAGPEGNGITIGVETSTDAQVILSPSSSALCCANTAGERVTADNPAVPGETVILYGTGLGLIKPEEAKWTVTAGFKYTGPELNEPVEFVYALAGGKTANVLFSGLRPGSIGIYELQLELNSDIPTNPQTQLTIAQSFQVSNIVSFPVVNNLPPAQ